MREGQTEVLVVGAGPVGLWTSLLLAQGGIETLIIDREERTTSRSYACALQPGSLQLLQDQGLAESLLAQGRRINRMAFYDGESQQAQVDLSRLGGNFPFLLTLPQSAFETALEQRLKEAGVEVRWGHRFDDVSEEPESVTATVEELSGTSTGYIVPHWETIVKGRSPIRTQLLIGADGHNSLVRKRLGLAYRNVSEAEFFAAFEFETERPVPDEVRVVLLDNTTNVLWPLPGNKCRWTFQVSRSDKAGEFPEKERRAVRLEQPTIDGRLRESVERVAHRRAPWFSAGIKAVTWCTEVAFQAGMVEHFGRDRCWLAGDAAHQTGPVGVQSMNVGLVEAQKLARAAKAMLKDGAPGDVLAKYNREQQAEWQALLGLNGGLKPKSDTPAWVREGRGRILPCLPACGADLASLADQLALDFALK